MIRKLKGIIDTIFEDSVIIDVAGVGYHAFCSANTLRSLQGEGKPASLHIETHVREDHIHLYGFANTEEHKAFNTLQKVSGVGAKMALSVLSALTPVQLSHAIAADDKAAFRSANGVGPKLAARITTELKDKFSISGDVSNFASSTQSGKTENNEASDAISALVNLGYNRSDAYIVVNKLIAGNDNMDVSELIRQGLKELGKK